MTTINELLTNFKNLVKKYHYTKTEVDTALANKASKDAATTETAGLMTAADKVKLNGIDTGATATTVDSSLSDSSENPVQNKVIKDALDDKADASDLATVATSGSYDDLSDKPDIPSKTSDLTNDGDGTNAFLTQHQDISGKANVSDLSAVATSGDYDDLSNKPNIPSETSDLTNDSGFLTNDTLIQTASTENSISNNGIHIVGQGGSEEEDTTSTFTLVYPEGSSFYNEDSDLFLYGRLNPEEGETVTIDWGDGNTVTYEYGDSIPTYYSFQTQEEHTVTIDLSQKDISNVDWGNMQVGGHASIIKLPYGITNLNMGIWGVSSDKLTSFEIPSSVETIEADNNGTPANNINISAIGETFTLILHWTENVPSITSNPLNIDVETDGGEEGEAIISIPAGTMALYTAAGYDSSLLVERPSTNSNVYIKNNSNLIELMKKDDFVVEDIYEVTSNKGIASASTLNKFYIEVDGSNREVYYTEEDNGTYSWHKLDTDVLDGLSIDWADIENRPSIPSKTSDLTNDSGYLTTHQDISGKANSSDLATVATSGSYTDLTNVPNSFTPSSHTHGNLTNDGKIGSTSGKPIITGTGGAIQAGDFGTTSGTFAEGNHTHSQYLTDHQDISGKEDSSNKVNSWSSTTTDTHYPTEKLVKDSLDEKISKSQTVGLVKNDGTIDTTTYLSSHQDISGKENSSNKVSSWSGTTTDDHYPSEKLVKDSLDLKANSSSLSTVATSGSYTDLSNIPSTFAPTAHSHSAADVTDSTAHTAIGSAANATQANINTLIDSKISSLLSIELITIESTRPTASADTMNKLYLIPESTGASEDNYEVFVTVKVGSTYSWEKLDTARLDLSGYYTKTQADNTFVKQADFVDTLNTVTTNLLNAE